MTLTQDQITALHDKQCLYENLMLYCRGADRLDIDLIKSTYWPDSFDDHGGYVGDGYGWADFIHDFRDRLNSCNHHVTNVLCEIEGNRAKRESMFNGVVVFKEPDVTFFHGGRYRDLCEKREGEWKILRRVCIWDWSDVRKTEPGWDIFGIPVNSNWGSRSGDDPIYKDWFASEPTARPSFQSVD